MGQQPLSQVPDTSISKMAASLQHYTTALLKTTIDREGRRHAKHIGAGTFVSVGGTHGILTAHHVTRELNGPCSLAMTISTDAAAFSVDKNHLRILPIAEPQSDEYGPDLSFVVLAHPDVGSVKASMMSFWPLAPDREEMLLNPPPSDVGIWFACGTPGERIKETYHESGFDKVIALEHFCGAGGPSREYSVADFDYIEMDTDCPEEGDLPQSYEGMSGGGLWQVKIRRSTEGDFIPTKTYFAGLVFYEVALGNRRWSLRCHGRRSIYERLYSAVELQCA